MPPSPPREPLRSKPLSDLSLSLDASRKSVRKRKSRDFPDAATTFKPSPASASGAHKSWSETEELALLKAAVRFRARTGSAPRTPDMEEFFESVKESLGVGMDQVRVFYKLKRLKSKFLQSNGTLTGPHERLLYKLSAEIWGSETLPKHGQELEGRGKCDKEDGEMEGGKLNCAFVTEALREYWRENGTVNSEVLLEDGLRCMNPAWAMKLEMKWRELVESDMRLKMKRHEIFKEVYSLLAHTVKNS